MFRNDSYSSRSKGSPFKTAKFQSHARNKSRSPKNTSFTSRSNTSTHTDLLRSSLQEIQIFPTICLEMLKHEERNIANFKKSIMREKNRVNSEMESVTVEITHMLEDYRLSLTAVLDRIYQNYINLYGEFKSELMDINRMKDQLEMQVSIQSNNGPVRQKKDIISNQFTLKTLEAGKNQLRKFTLMSYIAQMQKEKIFPVKEKAESLLILSEYQNGFFQPEEFKAIITKTKVGLREELHNLIQNSSLYIRDPEALITKELMTDHADNQILTELDNPQDQPIRMKKQPNQYSLNLGSEQERQRVNMKNFGFEQERQRVNINFQRPEIRSQQYIREYDSEIQHMRTEQEHSFKMRQKRSSPQMGMSISNREMLSPSFMEHQPYSSHSQSIVSLRKITVDQIKVGLKGSFKSTSPDIMLCCLLVRENLIAVGNRDGSLNFYNESGNLIKSFPNSHKSSICCLSLINESEYLATGSDHPNSEIILWNLSNLEPVIRLKEHQAAVTAIQCLRDNEHMISGSYDKRLCIYSIHERKLKYTLPANKSSVTAIVLNSDGSKMISCGLEGNVLNIWEIVREHEKVETIFLSQVIENNTMICSVVSSAISHNLLYIGTKDGKLKIVDIEKGTAIKTVTCCNNALIQMLIIEQANSFPLVFGWPCKQKCFKIVDCESGKVVNINSKAQLQFSCGVGPKVSGASDGSGFVLGSQGEDREVYFYRINRQL